MSEHFELNPIEPEPISDEETRKRIRERAEEILRDTKKDKKEHAPVIMGIGMGRKQQSTLGAMMAAGLIAVDRAKREIVVADKSKGIDEIKQQIILIEDRENVGMREAMQELRMTLPEADFPVPQYMPFEKPERPWEFRAPGEKRSKKKGRRGK